MNEHEIELRALGQHIRTVARQRFEDNKNGDRRDPRVHDLLKQQTTLRSEGRLLDAIALDREAYTACVHLVLQSLLSTNTD